MISTDKLSICYSGNRRVFPLILLSVLSVARVTSEPVSVYVLTMDLTDLDPRFEAITEEQREILEAVLKEHNLGSGAALLDGRDAYFKSLAGGKNDKNGYTPYALGRLLLTEFELPERVLYLDSDVMCCSNLGQIREIDLAPYEFAAALDEMGKFWIKRDYCNSGVMYLNMKKIRETGLFARACAYVKEHKLAFPDQTALNRLAADKLILPRRFNEQREIKEDTVLKHFCRGIKWLPFFRVYNYKQSEIKNVHKKLKIYQFDGVYEEYAALARRFMLPPLEG